jgi:hypothetical protein
MGWTHRGSEVLHEGPFMALHRDSAVRPDGSAGTYEHVAVDDGVRVVAPDEHGQVVLVDFYLQRRRFLHLPGSGCVMHWEQRPPEQFTELLPVLDRLAEIAGVFLPLVLPLLRETSGQSLADC